VLRGAGLAAAAAIALAPGAAAAFCPCYTLSSASNSHNCGVEAVNGTNPTTAQWNDIFALVSQGPAVWGNKGPSVGDIGQGCGKPEKTHNVPAEFPCELLKGIASQETGWRQFCVPDTPADEVGGPSRTIISFDCGYGIGQVTSGMHKGETPNFDRTKVAGDPTYNLATGTQILAAKWKATNCVGDNQPKIIEDWYIATWAYNGLAYVNNPSNPNYDPNRGVWNPKAGGAAPYQEKVFGWIEHPQFAGVTATALAYPNPGDVGGGGVPPDLPEPDCASPTNCVQKRSVHDSACIGQAGAGGSGGSGGSGGAGGSGGSGGSGGTGGSGGSGGSGGIGGIDVGVGGSGGTADTGGSAANNPSAKASCSCRLAGSDGGSQGSTALAMAGAIALLFARAGRRRPRRGPVADKA
jgi:hypothetical protein